MKPDNLLAPGMISPEQYQPLARTDAGPGAWLREWWRRLCPQPPWLLRVEQGAGSDCCISLSHEHKGLIRRWQGCHARLLLSQPCFSCTSFRRNRQATQQAASQCRLQQHQVAHLLMAAAATELMLKRLVNAQRNGHH